MDENQGDNLHHAVPTQTGLSKEKSPGAPPGLGQTSSRHQQELGKKGKNIVVVGREAPPCFLFGLVDFTRQTQNSKCGMFIVSLNSLRQVSNGGRKSVRLLRTFLPSLLLDGMQSLRVLYSCMASTG